jgi:WD40 repeat protein
LERTVRLAGVSTDAGAFSPDFKIWASPRGYQGKGKPNTVLLFNIKSGAVISTLVGSGTAPVGGGQITTLAFSPDGNILAVVSSDYTTRMWDVRMGKLLRTLHGHNAGVWKQFYYRKTEAPRSKEEEAALKED